MSYLSQPTSTTDYGVVKIGSNVNVDDGIISVADIVAGAGVTVTTTPTKITISATGADLIHVYGTTTNYTATPDDEYIGVNSTGAVTITLPAGIPGRVYTIKDEHGQGSGKITIQPQAGEKIDNATSYIISVPFQSVNVVFRAGTWYVI
jgi:hypothetical protein